MRWAGGPSRLLDLSSILAAVFVAAVAVAFALTATELTRTVIAVSSDPLRDAEGGVVPGRAPAALPGIAGKLARGERITVLLLGYGGGSHSGAYLADSLMVVSFDANERVGTLLSIPRDLWVSIPSGKYSRGFEAKINEAFALGTSHRDRDEGIRLSDAVVSDLLGIEIDRTVAVDFNAFRTVVDAVGGIDLEVERDFVALYPRNDDPDVDDSWMVVSFKRGRQHMDGETALRYARARYSDGPEGSDFARAVRQQRLLLSTKEKVASVEALPRLFSLLGALREDVRTDLSIADLQALLDAARFYDESRTARAALSPLNVLQSGYSEATGYVLVPRVSDWSDVRAYVRRVLEHPNSVAESPEVVVRVSRSRAADGEAALRRLKAIGFTPRLELWSGLDPERTQVVDDGTALDSAEFLADYFRATVARDENAVTPIVVRLGRDWTAPREVRAPAPDPDPTPLRAGASAPGASPGP